MKEESQPPQPSSLETRVAGGKGKPIHSARLAETPGRRPQSEGVHSLVTQSEVILLRREGAQVQERVDYVAVEEPLEIRLRGESLTVTMRTPGDDFALVAGFLLAEGIVASRSEIEMMGYGSEADDPEWRNVVDVCLVGDWRERQAALGWDRKFAVNSSCGVCGKANLEAIRCVAPPLPRSDFRVPVSVIQSLAERMRAAQQTFDRTGGLHAAALFDREGSLLALKEDVGRHNAVDKVIGGELLANRLPLAERILLVSGRASFEIIQKAAVARIPLVCAVSAPSSLAVQLARDLNMTLVGFLRGETMNLYAVPERLTEASPPPESSPL